MGIQGTPAKRPKKKGSRYDRIVFWGIIVAVVAIALLLWGPFHKAKKTIGMKPPVSGKQREITAVVAIVIDDLGQDMKPAQDLLDLPDHITLGIMPRLPFSKKIAETARRSGREVLVHIPMEAKGRAKKRSSPGILRSDMTPMEFIAAVNEDLDSVPGAAGANNHEGSSLTENREAMTFLMSELKTRGLFFLDSTTSPKSAAYTVAREFGLRSARRDVFLDNDGGNPAAIRKQLDELARAAKQNGRAIGIGHPHPATIAELKKWLTKIEDQGIEVVPVSFLVK